MYQTNSWPFCLESAHSDIEIKLDQEHFLSESPRQTSLTLTLTELHQHYVYLKRNYLPLFPPPLYKAKRSDSIFYIKPWMKLLLWGNYFWRKIAVEKAFILSAVTPSQLGGCLFFSSSLIAALRSTGKKGFNIEKIILNKVQLRRV